MTGVAMPVTVTFAWSVSTSSATTVSVSVVLKKKAKRPTRKRMVPTIATTISHVGMYLRVSTTLDGWGEADTS